MQEDVGLLFLDGDFPPSTHTDRRLTYKQAKQATRKASSTCLKHNCCPVAALSCKDTYVHTHGRRADQQSRETHTDGPTDGRTDGRMDRRMDSIRHMGTSDGAPGVATPCPTSSPASPVRLSKMQRCTVPQPALTALARQHPPTSTWPCPRCSRAESSRAGSEIQHWCGGMASPVCSSLCPCNTLRRAPCNPHLISRVDGSWAAITTFQGPNRRPPVPY